MLKERLIDYINDDENALKNYLLGLEYEFIGQTASAFTFYLRAAERTEDRDLAYECLVRLGNMFKAQGNRKISVESMYHAAIAFYPERPEAYYYLSKFLEEIREYAESYTIACLGIAIKPAVLKQLQLYFPGYYVLHFQKAVAAWHRGRGKESRELFQWLVDNHWDEMDEMHREAVMRNINWLGCNPPSYIHRMYNWRKMYVKLRYQFPGSDAIRENYSQIYQDLFILSMVDGKRNGTFLEIGGAGPKYGNNTYLLEKDFGWKGVSVEFDPKFAEEYRNARPTAVIEDNALNLDYTKLIEHHFPNQQVIDYLQLDIEPASNTYECMLKIPFDKFKFRVITYEHDHYADVPRVYRQKSREFLMSRGYIMVANDMSPDGVMTFEDWWIHPDLVDPVTVAKMESITNKVPQDATEYMFPKERKFVVPNFDWGIINDNAWFKDVVTREVFIDNAYQRFIPVKEGDVVVDIGASVGPFARSIEHAKPGRVICLEPHESLYKTLCKNASYAICVNKAIGYTDGLEAQEGLFDPDKKYSHDDNLKLVPSTTWKSFLEDYKVDHINFLKLDCEGGEYAIFDEPNMDWILKNVDYISGEWHLSTPELKAKFRVFRDKYLTRFKVYDVLSVDYVDIKGFLFDEWFIDRYEHINIYIDNRKKVHTLIDNKASKEKKYIKDKWKYSVSPTLEFTTSIPEKGCVVDCVFCPQKTLLQKYTGERRLSLENFKKVVDKLPKEIRVTFSGFTEPFLNSDCTEMILYAHDTGHPVSVFTTLVGVKVDDLKRIRHIPFAGPPNGGFTVHLPDQERRAKHPINQNYIATAAWFAQNMGSFQNATLMSMGTVHESVAEYYRGLTVHQNDMWDRAGNLKGEAMLKEELKREKFKSVSPPAPGVDYTCGCDERLYHNIVLPNGDVSLCCMDYGLEEITGNIFESEYNDVIPDPYEVFKMCARCENRIDVNSRFIRAERNAFNV